MTANGTMGRFLLVDLSRAEARSIPVPPGLYEDFIGGKGIGAKLLYDLVPAGVDPLGPDNVLMFLTGPLTATLAPAMRACVVTKSPLTGTFLDSYFGGRFGPEIKYAGYDGLIITGRAGTSFWASPPAMAVPFDAARWVPSALANTPIRSPISWSMNPPR